MKRQFGKLMKSKYNIVIVVSVALTALIALGLGFSVTLFFEKESMISKGAQLIVAIFSMTTFYAPIKFRLLKLFKVEEKGDE